jgi:4-amino-4-deoxy-L-arabinose transferase-like glycosyltransferase
VRRDLVLITLVAAATCLAGLGRAAIGDTDEAFYAEAVRELLETGDWLTPHYNYEERLQKPILYYWLAALASAVAGPTAATTRLPAALAGLGLTWSTYAIGRSAFDAATGRLGALIVATNFGTFFMARQALPDLPLALFVTLTTWMLIRALLDQPRPASRRVGGPGASLTLAALFGAAALLTKGPVGLALPAMVVGPLFLWERRGWRASARPAAALRWRHIVAAALLFAGLAIPWYAAMVRVHGWQYLQDFFVGENLERFATDRFNEPRPLWFYLPIIAGGLLPWSPFALLWIAPALAALAGHYRPSAWTVRLLAWAGAPLIFFSLSVGKQPRYMLPLLPPLAVLLARAIARRTERPHPADPAAARADRLVLVSGLAAALVIGASAGLLARLQPLLALAGTHTGVGTVSALAMAGTAVATAAVRRPRTLPAVLVGAATACWLIVHYSVFSSPGPEPVERVAALVENHRKGDEPVGRYRVLVRNLVFYTRVRHVDLITDEDVVRFLRSPQRVLCVLDEGDLQRLRAHTTLDLVVLGAVPYMNTLNLHVGTILRPVAARDVRRVLVVSNRATNVAGPDPGPQTATSPSS